MKMEGSNCNILSDKSSKIWVQSKTQFSLESGVKGIRTIILLENNLYVVPRIWPSCSGQLKAFTNNMVVN
jgi:hypothetical protein